MLIEFGADMIPVVFLTTDSVDTSSADTEDAVVVEGQEGLEEEAATDTETAEEGTEEADLADETTEADGAEEVTEGDSEDEAATDGEEGTDEVAVEGDETGEEAVEGEVVEGDVVEDGEMVVGETGEEGMDMGTEETQEVKDPLLSSPVFVGGISLAVLVVGGVLGFFLARRKIKKGIELYEDI